MEERPDCRCGEGADGFCFECNQPSCLACLDCVPWKDGERHCVCSWCQDEKISADWLRDFPPESDLPICGEIQEESK